MNRNELYESNRSVTGRYLQMLQEMTVDTVRDRIVPDRRSEAFCYYRITEIQKHWLKEGTPLWDQMSSLFVGLSAVGAPISVVFSCDGEKLSVCVGSRPDFADVLEGMLHGVFPHIRLRENEAGNPDVVQLRQILPDGSRVSGGFLKGNPVGSENVFSPRQIDGVIKGMQSCPWHYVLFALPVPRPDTIRRQQEWMTEVSECGKISELSVSESDGRETLNSRLLFPHGEQFLRKAKSFIARLTESAATGEWRVTANFGSDSELHARLLGGLLVSAFFGEDAEPPEPEPMHAVYYPGGSRPETICTDTKYPESSNFDKFPLLFVSCPRYSTYLSSRELGVLAAFPTVDTAGFSTTDPVQFDVAREITGALSLGRILDGNRITENKYTIDPNELNRHCLVVGLTGAGKTNTIKSLIRAMTHGADRPFLVIEPAKKEYWELFHLGYPDLQIYSVGTSDPAAHPFCINPFERAVYTDALGVRHQVSLQTHIDFVFAAFKASFIMYTPMPYVLEQAIYRIYEECGWDVMNDTNRFGTERYPTMEDLYYAIPAIVTEMGFDKRMRSDLIGSMQARINTMRLGAKGATLNVPCSFPMDQLLKHNVVIELEDIGDDDVKAFMISVLLISLLEIRRQQPDAQQEVRHLLLIEEAHRLLKNVQSGTGENADPRGAAVEFFCNLLAELRSKGQGFIVADQIPSKLAPDLIKNTNLKITHRTVALEERELIGGAMHMTDEQVEALASLRQGVAAVYSEGDDRPKLVKAPFAGEGLPKTRPDRRDVLHAVAQNCISAAGDPRYAVQTNRQTFLCRRCSAVCTKHPNDIFALFPDPDAFTELADSMNPRNREDTTINASDLRMQIRGFLEKQWGSRARVTKEAELCVLQCLYQAWNSSDAFREEMGRAYLNLMKGK